MGELLLHKPLLPGKDEIDQVHWIQVFVLQEIIFFFTRNRKRVAHFIFLALINF